MLLTWPFERADKEFVVSYLNTEADGKVIALYEKPAWGLEGVYTHVAMVRELKSAAGKEEH